ncbi:MAG: DUF3343 domain-containing protein [Eubacteriales bacterium]|nr:DUF3343 domain-containing protein [Eubacteriales bacterium]
MKQKQLRIVVTFHTTAEAMATEQLCRERGLEGKLISAPRALTADCGIAWSGLPETKELLLCALAEANIEIAGTYDMEI